MAASMCKQLLCYSRRQLLTSLAQQQFSTYNTLNAIDKKVLTSLRKKTGYSFTKCNEALKVADNNLQKAEEWLYKQAEKEGWSKAQKLKDRSTSQGLVGVLVKNNFVSLVEVACETDFVARNELFQGLVASTASAVLNFREQVIQQNLKVSSNAEDEITHLREVIMEHELKDLIIPTKNITVEERVVSLVGKIGENIKLKRAMAIATNSSNIIGTSTHGSFSFVLDECQMGSYAGVVVLKSLHKSVDREEVRKIAKGLSQHVIGMNPLGLKSDNLIAEEDSFLGQDYLLNEKVKVGDLVENSGVEIIDFVRYGVSG